MKEEGNAFYEAPAINVVYVKTEGVVCQTNVNSGLDPMGEPEDL